MVKLTLCCRGKKCPVVTLDEKTNEYKITDDNGGKVTLHRDELDLLLRSYAKGLI